MKIETTAKELARLSHHIRLSNLLSCVDQVADQIMEWRANGCSDASATKPDWSWDDVILARALQRNPVDSFLLTLTEEQQAALIIAVDIDGDDPVTLNPGWVGVKGAARRTARTRAVMAGIIRGELELDVPHGEDCLGVDADGSIYIVVRNETLGIEAKINRGEIHPLIAARARYREDYITGKDGTLISARYKNLSLHSMAPWPASPLAINAQQQLLDQLQRLDSDAIDGLVFLGPPGVGKTAWVSAWIKDEITLRLVDATRTTDRYELNVSKIKFASWLEEMHAWMHKSFDDNETKSPEVTGLKIRETTRKSGVRPILWVEEIDKVKPTEKQATLFNALVDAVYELGGLIIVTGNGTRKDLEDRLKDSTVRRFAGNADLKNRYPFYELS